VDTATCITTYWHCNEEDSSRCTDSSKVEDPENGYDFVRIDSVFDIWTALGDGKCQGLSTLPQPWGVSFIFQMKNNPNQYEVERVLLPDDVTSHLGLLDVDQYKSITIAFSAA